MYCIKTLPESERICFAILYNGRDGLEVSTAQINQFVKTLQEVALNPEAPNSKPRLYALYFDKLSEHETLRRQAIPMICEQHPYMKEVKESFPTLAAFKKNLSNVLSIREQYLNVTENVAVNEDASSYAMN